MLLNRLITGDSFGPQIARKGGGGGGTTTNVSGLPEEFRPYIRESLASAQDAYKAGALEEVAGLTPEQQDAFQRKLELGQRGGVLDRLAEESYGAAGAFRDAAAGQGLFGADAIQKQTEALTAGGDKNPISQAVQEVVGQGRTANALGGRLGSARAGAQTEKAAYDTASNIASQELDKRRQASFQGAQGVIGSGQQIGNQFGAGVKATEGVGGALQQQNQREADAAYQGLQRLFGLYGSPALGSESKATTSGGGK